MFNKHSLMLFLKLILIYIVIFGMVGCSTVMNFKPLSAQKDRYEIRIFPSAFSSEENNKKLVDEKAQEFASFMHYKNYEIVDKQNGYGYPIESNSGGTAYMLLGVQSARFIAYTLQFNR